MASVLARNEKDTPLFTNNTQELAIPRFMHNANVPLLGLPDEVLVHIIKLMQSRFHITGRAHARRISSYGDTAARADKDTLSWRHLMLVCTRMRDLALQSPELWSSINVQWPARWVQLCADRSASFPLHLICGISNRAVARAAAELIPRARDVVMIVHPEDHAVPYSTGPLWYDICSKLLDELVSPRSLEIINYDGGHWGSKILELDGASLWTGGSSSTLTHLDLSGLHLSSIPDLPQLGYLRLESVNPPPDPTWLHRLLTTSPELRYLGFLPGNTLFADTHVMRLDPSLPVPASLPKLAQLCVSGPLDVVVWVQHLAPVPADSLSILVIDQLQMLITQVERSTLFDAGQLQLAFDFVQRFWQRSGGHSGSVLPQAAIEMSSHTGGQKFCMSAEDRLALTITHNHAADLGPFLDYVTQAELIVPNLDNDIIAAGWPRVNAIPGLLRLYIVHNQFFAEPSAAVLRRTWMDTRARAGLPPVQVEFMNNLLRKLGLGSRGTPQI
jgi:hypothetical protein